VLLDFIHTSTTSLSKSEAMASPTVFPNSHVGFDSITSQIERKLLKRGFQFNVICVGESRRANPAAAIPACGSYHA
jgi:hypothetical protein